jgi:ATP-dependent RNA helicase SUPV3L1/SUV3
MRPPVIALLGPTNTGKTYLAIERMLCHRTGMIGFPLRLLARENYDRVVQLRGRGSAALITGEERIVPPAPCYYLCTVEAMPLDRSVDFLAVDEIQLAADRERGHVFTDRLLHARGHEETIFLGAETIRPLMRLLVPEAELMTRPRLSTLTYAEPRKLARMPRRSAIIVFSVADLYQTAERVRRETGGAALVFGALSPRTRNAQVALYQARDVDFLVATDAIGMGLNLDIDHVAFTGLAKFDGVGPRRLRPAEVGQIAGRAGRHVRDGSFGATADLGPFDRALVQAVEGHRFEPLPSIYWRSSELSFASVAALVGSLERRPPLPQLVRMRHADDHKALSILARAPEIAGAARDPASVELLWDVCQVPDFRNVLSDAHTRLLAQIFGHLAGPARRLPEDWVSAQVQALDRVDGDTDTLLGRIAAIRTWTYVSHRRGWLADAAHWQERTRAVEDRLSDALHERLTEQFVDRRAAVVARLEPGDLVTQITEAGDVLVQGLLAGQVQGFRFVPDPGLRDSSRPLLAAANRTLRSAIGQRVDELTADDGGGILLDPDGRLLWRGSPVGRLRPGERALSPRVEALASDLLDPPLRERVRRRLAAWVESHVAAQLGPLVALDRAPLSPASRALAFALAEALGSVPRRAVARYVRALVPRDRGQLQRLGLRFGVVSVSFPVLLKPSAIRLRAVLFSVHRGLGQAPVPDGRPSVVLDPRLPGAFYVACGYLPAAARAVRADCLERLAAAARRAASEGPLAPSGALTGIIGCRLPELAPILETIGYVRCDDGSLLPRPPKPRKPQPAARDNAGEA